MKRKSVWVEVETRFLAKPAGKVTSMNITNFAAVPWVN